MKLNLSLAFLFLRLLFPIILNGILIQQMRRQFTSKYEQVITLIKQLKNSNDSLNRSIGIDSSVAILSRLKRQQSVIDSSIKKIEDTLIQLQQSYLDPDTARKIGTAKQQFRIQRDRREQLLNSANYHEALAPRKIEAEEEELPTTKGSQNQEKEKYTGSTWNKFTHRSSDQTHQNSLYQKQDLEIQFQMQRRLMQQKNSQIEAVTKSIMNVHNIMSETGSIVNQQGEKLDIISDQIFSTYRNVHDARENVIQANQHQQRARRKYVVFSLLILVGLAIGALFILF